MGLGKAASGRAALLAGALAIASTGFAHEAVAGNVSGAFDGDYAGTRVVIPGLSSETCPEGETHSVTVTDGHLQGGAEQVGRLAGIVTEDGFFTGRYWFVEGGSSVVEGRIVDGELVAGVIREGNGCAWILKLAKRV